MNAFQSRSGGSCCGLLTLNRVGGRGEFAPPDSLLQQRVDELPPWSMTAFRVSHLGQEGGDACDVIAIRRRVISFALRLAVQRYGDYRHHSNLPLFEELQPDPPLMGRSRGGKPGAPEKRAFPCDACRPAVRSLATLSMGPNGYNI
jgi:hypothetical protein